MDGWKREEAICFIAHTWADKENEKGKKCLQDFDFSDMANAAELFIKSFPSHCSFITHIENCFDKLVDECEGAFVEWTPEFFSQYY